MTTQTKKSTKRSNYRQEAKKSTKKSVVKLKPAQKKLEPIAVVPQPTHLNNAPSRRQRSRKASGKFSSVGLSLLQMVIVGAGLGAIAGDGII